MLGKVFTACLGLLIVVVGLGLGADSTVADFRAALARPQAVYCGLLSQYCFMPLCSWLMARASGASVYTQIGMILVGSAPGGTTSNLFTLWAKGDVPLSITMSFFSTLAAFFMLPALVFVYIDTLSESDDIRIPWSQIIVSCFLIALPTTLGLVTRRHNTKTKVCGRFIWEWMHKATSMFGGAFVVGAAVVGCILYGDELLSAGWKLWFFALLFEPLGAAFGYGAASYFGLPRPQRRTVAMECGVQNSSFTIAMVTLSFGSGRDKDLADALLFPLMYSFSYIFNSSWLVAYFRWAVAPLDAEADAAAAVAAVAVAKRAACRLSALPPAVPLIAMSGYAPAASGGNSNRARNYHVYEAPDGFRGSYNEVLAHEQGLGPNGDGRAPFDKSSFFGKMAFDYVRPLLRLGAARPLLEADLPALAARDDIGLAVVKVSDEWARELQACAERLTCQAGGGAKAAGQQQQQVAKQQPGSEAGQLGFAPTTRDDYYAPPARPARWASARPVPEPSLFWALVAAHRREFWLGGLLSLLEELSILLQFALIAPLLDFASSPGRPTSEGYRLAGLMAVASLAQAVLHHQNFLVNMRCGWSLRCSVTGLLHAKLLRVTSGALHGEDSSSVYNLVASDTMRFDNVMPMLHLGWAALPVSCAVVWLLCRELGWRPTAAGAGTMLAFVFLQVYFGKQFGRRRRITAKITDRRVRLTSEMLSGVASVKAYAWEEPFLARLGELRGEEHASIFRSQSMKAVTLALFFASSAVASLAAFGTYKALGKELRVTSIYTSVALFNLLRVEVGTRFARVAETGPECLVAIERMRRFLLLPEVALAQHLGSSGGGSGSSSGGGKRAPNTEAAPETGPGGACAGAAALAPPLAKPLAKPLAELLAVELVGASFGRRGAVEPCPAVVAGVTCGAARGEVVVVCGPVGCGKSTLLDGLLGEADLLGGACALRGSAALSPQEPWVMAGSLLSNILFGEPLDAERLASVVAACALGPDIDQLPDGLDTEIGEKGVNLSGGQKARVSLARACYARAEVVLLDDPLSAVDPAVAKHLFNAAIVGWLATTNRAAVVLVTHQRQFLKFADKVLLLGAEECFDLYESSADGFRGTYAEVATHERLVVGRAARAVKGGVVGARLLAAGPALATSAAAAAAVDGAVDGTDSLRVVSNPIALLPTSSTHLSAPASAPASAVAVAGVSSEGGSEGGSEVAGASLGAVSAGGGKLPARALTFKAAAKAVQATVKLSSGLRGSLEEMQAAHVAAAATATAALRAFLTSPALGLSAAQVEAFLAFGVESLEDLLDASIVNEASLTGDIGLSQAEAARLLAVLQRQAEANARVTTGGAPTATIGDESDGEGDAAAHAACAGEAGAEHASVAAAPRAAVAKAHRLTYFERAGDGALVPRTVAAFRPGPLLSAAQAEARQARRAAREAAGRVARRADGSVGLVGRVVGFGTFAELKAAGLLAALGPMGDEGGGDGAEEGDGNGAEGPDAVAEDGAAKNDEGGTDVAAGAADGTKGKAVSGFTQLVGAEDREVGLVKRSTWVNYVTASGPGLAATVLLLFVLGQATLVAGDAWLLVWATADDRADGKADPRYFFTFAGLAAATTAVSFARALLFFHTTLRASSALHRDAAARLFGAPLSFFAATPAGRIVNRFSSDLAQVDEQLAVAIFDTLQIACMAAAGVIVSCAVLPPVLLVVPPVLYTMGWLRQYTTASMRELKRLDGTSRSPVYVKFRAALVGLACIRAYGRQQATQASFQASLDRNAKAWYWWLIANRWFGFWLDVLCFLVVGVTALLAVAMRDSVRPGLIGLALVYVLSLSGMFQYMMRQTALVETYMTSVERLSHYANELEPEEVSLAAAVEDGDRRHPLPRRPPGEPGAAPTYYTRTVAGGPLVARAAGDCGVDLGGGDIINGHDEAAQPAYFERLADGTLAPRTALTQTLAQLNLRPVPPRPRAFVGSGGGARGATSLSSSSSSSSSWPLHGALTFDGLRVRYRRDLPEVITGLNAVIPGGAKVGVVGRTGSGKSSLLLALSRLNEVCGGRVLVDGVDSCSVGLRTLRQAIAVIPQQPHLFSGSVRFNLDPFGEFSDAAVWEALAHARLRAFVSEAPGGLDAAVSEGGGNWSAGQRQLLSIARALLHKRKIVLLDEATASVDHEADAAIQHMLRSSDSPFKEATLVVIAHRIATVVDSDLILVMDQGRLAEFGPPDALLDPAKHPNGLFAALVAASRGKAKGKD